MASLEEFVSAVQSSIESLKQAQTSMDNPKQQADELSSQFQGLGAESMATGSQGLKDGVEQAQGMVPPIITQLEQIISSAQGMKSGLRAAAPDVRPPPTPLDAAPPSLREPIAKVGDPVSAPEPKPGAFRAELQSSDEDDEKMSKFRRASRGLVRKTSGIQDQVKDSVQTNAKILDAINPPPEGTYATTQVPSSPPQFTPPGHQNASPADLVGTAVVLAAVVTEAFSRRMRKRKK